MAHRRRAAGGARPLVERAAREGVRHFLTALKDPRVIVLAGVQFGFLVGSYGVSLFLPSDSQRRTAVGHRGRIRVKRLLCRCIHRHDRVGDTCRPAWRQGRESHVFVPARGRGFLGAILSSGFWMSIVWLTVALQRNQRGSRLCSGRFRRGS